MGGWLKSESRAGRAAACVLACAALTAPSALARGAAKPKARAPDQLSFLHVGPAGGPANVPQILDGNGREVLLRGVNVVGLRDDYVANGSLQRPYPTDPAAYANGSCPPPNRGVYTAPACATDAAQLASFGYDAVRLPVSWSLLEPAPGAISQQYLDRIAQVVGWFKTQGIYTIIDLHQDAWSKYLYTPAGATCPPPTARIQGFHEADGAPAWASVHVTPVCAVAGIRDLDLAVQEDFQRLYSDVPGPDGVGLQEHFANVVATLAKTFANDPAVAGYELLNEPEPGYLGPALMDPTELFPMYAKLIATARRRVPGLKQLFFIEPDVSRDIVDRSGPTGPWSLYSSYPNVVYAPHVYTGTFTLNAMLSHALDPLFPLNGGYDSAVQDALQLQLPLWVGEFGNGAGQDGTLLRNQYVNQDRLAVGGALWYWKGFADLDGHWSVLYDDATHTDAAYPSRVLYTDRAYPLYAAGTITKLAYEPTTGAVDLRATSRRINPGDTQHATVIHIPAAVTAPIAATGALTQTVPDPAGGRTALVYPSGGAYRVRIAAR
jgi:endoglycosylceramidase